jgi:hypothetical protein
LVDKVIVWFIGLKEMSNEEEGVLVGVGKMVKIFREIS